MHKLVTQALALLAVLTATTLIRAQTGSFLTDTLPSAKEGEYDYIFPIWGKDVVKRGFNIPYPVGLNLIGMYITQPINISELQLSLNDGALTPVPVVKFGSNSSTVLTTNFRADLWLFPFLNVYGMYGVAQANTTVELTSPAQFTSSVDQPGQYYGVGLTTAFGIWDHWGSVDVNWAWADLEKLSEPVLTNVIGLRFGHTFPLNDKGMKLAAWVGMMSANVASVTDGSILISDALPQEVLDALEEFSEGYQESEWYQNLQRWQQAAVDELMQRLSESDNPLLNSTVNYNINKALAVPTNMLLGAQWEINKEWVLRAEAGLFGRWSAMLNLNYRFRI